MDFDDSWVWRRILETTCSSLVENKEFEDIVGRGVERVGEVLSFVVVTLEGNLASLVLLGGTGSLSRVNVSTLLSFCFSVESFIIDRALGEMLLVLVLEIVLFTKDVCCSDIFCDFVNI